MKLMEVSNMKLMTWKEKYGHTKILFSKHAVRRAEVAQMDLMGAIQALVDSVEEPFKLRHNPKREASDKVYINGTIHFVGKEIKGYKDGKTIFKVITLTDTAAVFQKNRFKPKRKHYHFGKHYA